MRQQLRPSKEGQRGFTLIELLVVIVIVSILAALSLTAILRARVRANQTACLARMCNVGQALLQSASTHHDLLPATGTFYGDQNAIRWGSPLHGWVVDILPSTDPLAADKWDFSESYVDVARGQEGGQLLAGNSEISQTHQDWLLCPADPAVGPGKLSYVVNGGANLRWTWPTANNLDNMTGTWMDYDGDGQRDLDKDDQRIARALGLMWPGTPLRNTPQDSRRSVANLFDGAAQTLLVSENLHSGPTYFDSWWNLGDDAYEWHNWASPDPNFVAFRISDDICPQGDCRRINWAMANSLSAIDNPLGLPEKINGVLDGRKLIRKRTGDEPRAVTNVRWPWPYPSSHHGGGVNVVFADGHGQFLDEDVDGKVYASLVSPEGSRLEPGIPVYQPPLSEAAY